MKSLACPSEYMSAENLAKPSIWLRLIIHVPNGISSLAFWVVGLLSTSWSLSDALKGTVSSDKFIKKLNLSLYNGNISGIYKLQIVQKETVENFA